MNAYLAHRNPDTGETQTVLAHLEETARRAQRFATPFGGGELGYRCGLLHDIGKYSNAFQKRLLEHGPKVDHATAGAKEAFFDHDLNCAFCIAGHHGGLPDGGSARDTPDEATLMGRMKRVPGQQIPAYSEFQNEISMTPAQPPDYPGESRFAQSFFIRMLFSCLVDADFLDTEAFMEPGRVPSDRYVSIQTLLERLERYIEPWWGNKSPINQKRNSILHAALASGTQTPGLFTLTVPTGGGKTVSSMAFALQHGLAHNKQRVIYVIPYTSIIEQTVCVFSEMLGEDQVIAHYANAEYGEEPERGTYQQRRRPWGTENWDAPIIVTTAVQFFESLFSNRTSRCRKLHHIAESILIFDEAQTLPAPYLRPCLAAICQLTTYYGCSAVLCTATQPALVPLLKEFAPQLVARELCPDPQAIYQFFRRVQYKKLGTVSNNRLAQYLNRHHQVLCIVNSQKQAREMFRLLTEEGAFHLSTRMTPQDRRVTLEQIRKQLKEGQPCRVVSTSLIEAGVDVDFPTVYREQCGLDALIQAGGRCNRENKRALNESVVYWFATQDGTPPAFARTIAAAQAVMEMGELDAPETIHAYFDLLLYQLMGTDALDQKGILTAFERGIQGNRMPFATVAQRFRLIERDTVPVYIPLDEGASLIAQISQQGISQAMLRRLGNYAVDLCKSQFERLLQSGAVALVDEHVAILTERTLYNHKTGFSFAGEEGQALFV